MYINITWIHPQTSHIDLNFQGIKPQGSDLRLMNSRKTPFDNGFRYLEPSVIRFEAQALKFMFHNFQENE